MSDYTTAYQSENNAEDMSTAFDDEKVAIRNQLTRLKTIPFTREDYIRVKPALDHSHDGLEEIKKHILSQIALIIVNKQMPKPLLLVGKPGTGKTTLLESLADSLGKGKAIIQLAGMTGSFILNGNDEGYKNATIGKILKAFLTSESKNPVIILDELDKVGSSNYNGKTTDALLDILDKQRAVHFVDNYLETSFDASKAWYLLTANSLEGIPETIIDRCDLMFMPEYSFMEKRMICEKTIKNHNDSSLFYTIRFTEKQINTLVFKYGTSIRNLKRTVESAFSLYAMNILEGTETGGNKFYPYDLFKQITEEKQPSPFTYKIRNEPGIAPALAVNKSINSGLVLPIETKIRKKSTCSVSITGRIGVTMMESVEVAINVLTNILNLPQLGQVMINIPYPIPKEGESAGLAILLALLSSYFQIPLHKHTAITGALTLNGEILPIGGVILKIRTAMENGYNKVLIPAHNYNEVKQYPQSLFRGIEIIAVESIDQAIAHALPKLMKKKTEKENMI